MSFLISDLGIKQLDFAYKIRFAQSYVSMVLSGAKTNPGPRFIDAVCRKFNVNPEWLINGKDPVYFIPDVPLSAEKTKILVKLQMLPPEKQQAIEDIIDAFLLKSMTDGEAHEKQGKKSGRKK